MELKKFQHTFFLTLTIFGLLLAFMVFKPFIGVLLLAVTFAIVFQPFYQHLLKRLGGKKTSLAALLTIFVVVVIVLTPLTFFTTQLVGETYGLYGRLTSDGPITTSVLSSGWLRGLEFQVQQFLPNFSFNIDFSQNLEQVAAWLVQRLGSVFTQVTGFLFSFFLWLLAFYYILKDGDSFKKLII
ncbi:hypothetical protein CL634_03440, partial [bacterium]|nr:hypothetical protein [bacterium]